MPAVVHQRTPAQPPNASPRRFPVLLRRAWYGLNQGFRRRIAHTGSTPDQYTVLRTLAESGRGGLTQTELKQRMSSDPNTITALVRRMERSGLLERRPHERDRRARRLRLRPAGRKRFHDLRAIAAQLQQEVLSVLPAADQEQFLAQLEAVADACRAQAEEASGSGEASPLHG